MRRLDLQCLWVNVLCIIGDSVGYWQKQSAVMGSIYQSLFGLSRLQVRQTAL
jgi:hypothetical protein